MDIPRNRLVFFSYQSKFQCQSFMLVLTVADVIKPPPPSSLLLISKALSCDCGAILTLC